jgi:diguanylate cyclase (GGDEF)-like protein
MKRFLWAVFLSCLLCTGGATGSMAATPVLTLSYKAPRIEIARHAEYHLDTSGTLRYEDVLAGKVPFRSHTGPSFQFSFRKAVLWIQCRLASQAGSEKGLKGLETLLVFDNATLGSLTLYVPVLNRGVPETVVLKGGWQAGKDSNEFAFLYPTFIMPEGLDGTRPFVIRVETPFALQFRATCYTLAAFKDTSHQLFLVIGFCSGILVAMLLYNLVLYTFVRERQYLWYILYVLFLLLWQCVLFGIVRYFWPGPGEWMVARIPAISALMALFALVFAIAFLETSRRAPRHHRLLQALVFCSAAIVALVFIGYQWIANISAYLVGQVGTVALFTAALASLRSGFKPARYYLFAVMFFLGASLIFLFRFYGWVPNNTFTMQAMFFGAAAEAILLSFALGYRIRIIEEEGLILREREKSLTEMVVTDELTGLFNRRFFSATLAKRIANSERTGEPLALLVMDVDHFKRYNDAYGHSEGDVILKRLGEVVLRNLREGDIACRYGGEEFVVILNHANLERAAEVAQRIRSRFEKELFEPRKGVRVPVSMSIGVGEWRAGECGGDLFIRCDGAMYRAKETGRNRVCLA